MIIAHHLIWTGYGWWLPNDPRGSTSKQIACDVIGQLGELHHGRKAIQPAGTEIREFYSRANRVVQHELLSFRQQEVSSLAVAFAEVASQQKYTCWACAIMPDHVHLLIRKHKHEAAEMIRRFQDHSRGALIRSHLRPADHPVWGGPGWTVYLDHPHDVQRTIRYVDANPPKFGLPAQTWGFVREYDGWPFHEGYSPKSPYARFGKGRRLRKPWCSVGDAKSQAIRLRCRSASAAPRRHPCPAPIR